jgi:outer membrane immunogenic protein
MLMLVSSKTCRVLLVACLSACMVQVAAATEVNVYPTTPPQQQGTDWTGFYLKTSPGSASNGISWMNPGPASGFSSPGAVANPASENFGYNFQSGNFVFGLEGSFAAANFDGRFTSPVFPAIGAPPTGNWTSNMSWLGTVTGKVGYSFGQWLPYVKAGFATADVGSPMLGSGVGSFSQTSTERGWTAGVGLEYQLSPKWSLGLEYLYTDLGEGGGPQNTLGGAPITGSPEVYSTALKTQSLMGRLNYKTGW